MDSAEGARWLSPDVNLGSSVTTGTGFQFGNGDGAWLAAEHVIPDIYLTMPPTDIPQHLGYASRCQHCRRGQLPVPDRKWRDADLQIRLPQPGRV